MLSSDLDEYLRLEDPANTAVLCNTAFKTMFAVYAFMLSDYSTDGPDAVRAINETVINLAVSRIKQIHTDCPNLPISSEEVRLLILYFQAAMLDAEVEILRKDST